MEKKDFKTMPVLTQKALENSKGVFIVDKDYNLDNSKLVVPRGMTIKFEKGSLNNGSLMLDDTLLDGLEKGCLNVNIEGSLRNEDIYTSQLSNGINSLAGLSLSGKTVHCDQNESYFNTIVIDGLNSNGTTNTIFDGENHTFICSNTFFSIRHGSKNVTIKNFIATAASTVTEIDFQEMLSSVGVENITISGNHINGFKIGMSINGDSTANSFVSSCTVKNNTIMNAIGTTPNHGYGIHLANARFCTVSGNWISNCDRHSIYHAYGDHNTISGNHIVNHRSNFPTGECGVSFSAIDVARRSTNLTISGNSIVNCYSIGIILASHSPSRETPAPAVVFNEKYGVMDEIKILNNTFVSTNNTDSTNGLPSIMVGTELSTPILPGELNTYYIQKVEILNNTFARSNTEQMRCIRVVHCKDTKISGNTFQFNAPTTGHTRELVEFYAQFANQTTMTSKVLSNTFVASNNISNYSVFCISFQNGVNNSQFSIEVSGNTLTNQYSGSNQNYKLYKPIGITAIAGPNLTLQAET
jgi:parallel beta-helix repeat protein